MQFKKNRERKKVGRKSFYIFLSRFSANCITQFFPLIYPEIIAFLIATKCN